MSNMSSSMPSSTGSVDKSSTLPSRPTDRQSITNVLASKLESKIDTLRDEFKPFLEASLLRSAHIGAKPVNFKQCPHSLFSQPEDAFPEMLEGCDPASHQWTRDLMEYESKTALQAERAGYDDPFSANDLLEASVEPRYNTQSVWRMLQAASRDISATSDRRNVHLNSTPPGFKECNTENVFEMHGYNPKTCYDMASHNWKVRLEGLNGRINSELGTLYALNDQLGPKLRFPRPLQRAQEFEAWVMDVKDTDEPEVFTRPI